ncbi:xylose isomerase [Mucilaginibacter rubeus]|uniref:Metabolite traffic protein EboE n=1 Tax=Mucilaginibacter rubeus TaxID=2027860 RepID=A0AAE6MHG7_9SPHI|nr:MULTISPECIES: metabolite traffic protein EboE [Mucilaginibacter]QEM03513.1 xylose isomerase [Mucilaginibacter rubeus]QEM16128.1 xylose isomerase [Mucilaginibacter gossypii]QTE41121.1 metabolite traffic protein EboE [Mucilaginibacter rubeus]QTE47724.1 metabolite traffic protein EboE [Mucilaginibacter rubeus]QTE59115.1 metabolite traffic protein EboE [Mucilaginibacter rubeus]
MKINAAHLTYCTNIHPAENWPETFGALKNHFPAIRAALAGKERMGIGLRLSNMASLGLLAEEDNLAEFKQWLFDHDAYVFTMNGFPYGGFHNTVVKDEVHAPDWTTVERVDYTLRLFHILAELLPEGLQGGISTSPLSYKPWHAAGEARNNTRAIATENILTVAAALFKIHRSAGVLMHLDIEPEPDGFLESGREFIDWFENDLLPRGILVLGEQFGLSPADAEAAVKQHINLCYDVCHFAIGYEEHESVIDELAAKGIQVGKIQISAALKAHLPVDLAMRDEVTDALARFNEPTYLHQVIAKTAKGELIRYPDLPEALADSRNPVVNEWRAHFHVPVFVEDMGVVQSTQNDIIRVLNKFRNTAFTQHLEVETYTWSVLPDELKAPLTQSIIRELDWVKAQIS